MTHKYSKMMFAAIRIAVSAGALAGGVGVAVAQESGSRYADILAEADIAARYNAQIERQILSQQREIASLEQDAATMDQTAADMVPLLQRMFDELDQFVKNDIPFFEAERTERMERLAGIVADPNASSSEKFRRLMEAYQIETEYGRTMSSYKGTLDDGREAEFARVGRITLLYRTVDGEESGYWDNQKKSWVPDEDAARSVERALRMAKEETAPDLMIVPVPAPQGGGS